MSRPSLTARLAREAAARTAQSLQRRLRTLDGIEGPQLRLDGRTLVNFCSNDYLGLAQHLDVVAALQEAAAWHGAGAGAAPLVCGHHWEHAALEELVADWLGYPRALVFGSGYLANLGVLQSLLAPGDVCIQDKLNHACLLDGARQAGCELARYPHADFEGALRQLKARPGAAAMIATDGVFSMDGDLAPLQTLALLACAENALLYVDDAHGAGVLGPDGRGAVAHLGLGAREVPLRLITLGKAFGGYGAVLAGREELVEAVLQGARSYLFSTALPPALAAAGRVAIETARREGWRRLRLAGLITRFRRGAQQLGLPLLDSVTPIQPLMIGDNAGALAASQALEQRGFLVTAIRPPTVPDGRARLRITLTAAHSERQVDRLLDALGQVFGRDPALRTRADASGSGADPVY
ncbi:MAG TPA: 8-amino-7-oxononanoate synthase [Xanthomonadaceae bacterium]|nr:8-amino-7-oxononanoate synthase [Xanthomonadaceae bacterium]